MPTTVQPQNQFLVESLQRKQRADSFLNSISREQVRAIFDLFQEFEDLNEVYYRVTAPHPDGLGLKVSFRTLRRVRSRYRAIHSQTRTEAMLDCISDMELESDLTQSSRIQNAIAQLLHEQAFEIARTGPGSPALKEILASIRALSELDFKRQKLLLQRENMQRPPAQGARHHRVDLNIVTPERTHPAHSPAAVQESQIKQITGLPADPPPPSAP